MFINKNLQLNNSKTKTAMDAKISIFICVEAIVYLLLICMTVPLRNSLVNVTKSAGKCGFGHSY